MVKQFKNSKELEFAKALRIYSQNIHPNLKTSTNEIAYWLDHYNSASQNKLYLLGFYCDGLLIGFAQFVYLKEERLIVFDYLVIDSPYRSMENFAGCMAILKRFIEREKLEFNYAIAEVGFLSENSEPSEYSKSLLRLFKFAGGGILNASYYQPPLGPTNHDSEMRAALVMFSYGKVDFVSNETYMDIVDSIYTKHYLRWYEDFIKDIGAYKETLDTLRARIGKENSKNKRIKVNGYGQIFSDGTQIGRESKFGIMRFVSTSLVLIVLLMLAMLQLRNLFKIPLIPFIAITILALLTFFAVLAVVSRNAMQVFTKLLGFLKYFSRKVK